MRKHIFFDLDSTLVTIEGLDYLAELKQLGKAIVPITTAAMNGEISMHLAMEQKIALLQPSKQDLLDIGQAYLDKLTLGAPETISELQDRGYICWILTGNFTHAAFPVAQHLGIVKRHVLANQLSLNRRGQFLRFHADHPLSHNDGKTTMLKKLGINLSDAVMIGDGSTDLATQDHVGLFIGFGGVVNRPKVAKLAKIYIQDHDLRAVIPHITTWQKQKSRDKK